MGKQIGIFFADEPSVVSKLITAYEHGGPSHCGFFWIDEAGNAWGLDTIPGYGCRQYHWSGIADRNGFKLLQVVMREDLAGALELAQQQIGHPYDFAALGTHPAGIFGWLVYTVANLFRKKQPFDCSGLVGVACHNSGLQWAKSLGLSCTPADLLRACTRDRNFRVVHPSKAGVIPGPELAGEELASATAAVPTAAVPTAAVPTAVPTKAS